MSSDEEEEVSNRTQFTIKHPEWRSQHVTVFLSQLDQLFIRFVRQTKDKRGAARRHRIRQYEKKSETPMVPGLPINFYDQAWLNSKGQAFQTYKIHPGPQYDLTIPPELALSEYLSLEFFIWSLNGKMQWLLGMCLDQASQIHLFYIVFIVFSFYVLTYYHVCCIITILAISKVSFACF